MKIITIVSRAAIREWPNKRITPLIIPAAFLLSATWLLGQIFRDIIWLTAILFYIPTPVIFLIGVISAGFAWRIKRKRHALMLIGIALAPCIMLLFVENHFSFSKHNTNTNTIRLIHWNIFHAHLGLEELLEEIQKKNPDLCAFSEFPRKVEIKEILPAFGEDYSGIQFSNMAVIARGSLSDGEWFIRGDGIKAYGVVWHSPQGECKILVVDLESNLFRHRTPRITKVRTLIAEWNPDIVVGDFNSPRRSRALSRLPSGFTHAYDAAGNGWSYTWPVIFPVFAIDQCIISKRILPLRYSLESSGRSDHRRQLLEFEMTSTSKQ